MAGGPRKALTTNPFIGCHSKPCREVLDTRVILDSRKACHGLKCSIPTATGGTLRVRKVNGHLVHHPDPHQNLLDTKSMEMAPKATLVHEKHTQIVDHSRHDTIPRWVKLDETFDGSNLMDE
jgi:hypothetical protein